MQADVSMGRVEVLLNGEVVGESDLSCAAPVYRDRRSTPDGWIGCLDKLTRRAVSLEERLQKLISQCGLASRRTAEEWITAGRVTVNGLPAQLGDRATWTGTGLRWTAVPCGGAAPVHTSCSTNPGGT